MPALNVRLVAAVARRTAAISERIPSAAGSLGAGAPPGLRASGKRGPDTIGLSVT